MYRIVSLWLLICLPVTPDVCRGAEDSDQRHGESTSVDRSELLAHFRFDGEIRDESERSVSPELKNVELWNNTLYLNGEYTHSNSPNAYTAIFPTPQLDYSEFSIAISFQPESLANRNVLTGGPGYRWFGLRVSGDGNLEITLNNQRQAFELQEASLKERQWTTVVCSCNLHERRIRVTVDGGRIERIDLPEDFQFGVASSNASERDKRWTFTNYSNGTVFHGLVDELTVFGRDLSDQEMNRESDRLKGNLNRNQAADLRNKPPKLGRANEESEPMADDFYEVPEGSAQELLDFIEKVKSYRPRSRDDLLAYRTRASRSLRFAAERILEKIDDESSEAWKTAKRILLEDRLSAVRALDAKEQQEVFDETVQFATHQASVDDGSSLLYSLARSLESARNLTLASEAYQATADLMLKSDSERIVKRALKMAGAARRMKLLGSEMVVQGKLIDGSDFDLASYRGKVVLVDFWATWCGPCIAELPNVKKHYELYRDKGFEVVGVSLDREREQVERFIADREISWANLFEDGAGWDHSVANLYGIMAIPSVILVNREGKAISLAARGTELGRLLEQELGPADPERIREVEEKMRLKTSAVKRSVKPAAQRQERAQLDPNQAVYVACGKPTGPGKVYQVDSLGQILGCVDLPSTPYGIVASSDAITVALPSLGLLRIAADGSYAPLAKPHVHRALDVAINTETGDLVVADNRADVLWLVGSDPDVEPRRIQSFEGSERQLQNMKVAMTADGFLLFASDQPNGVYRWRPTEDGELGAPLVKEDGDVAGDPNSTRWAFAGRSGLYVFDKRDPIAEVPFSSNQSAYLGGLVAASNGKFVTAIVGRSHPELIAIDAEEKTQRLLFAWQLERMTDIAIGPRMAWPSAQAGSVVSNSRGDELSLIEFDPPLPHTFETGDRLHVRFAYTRRSEGSCLLFARPMSGETKTPGYGAHGSGQYEKGRGPAEGWFTFSAPARMDHVSISMVDSDTRETVLELRVPAKANWIRGESKPLADDR